MNCAEFQEVLAEVFEGDRTAEQESHLQSCSVCSSLVAELDLIANEARQLQEVAEPNPRVWASIEIALRQVECTAHVRLRTARFIRVGQTSPVAVQPAPRVGRKVAEVL